MADDNKDSLEGMLAYLSQYADSLEAESGAPDPAIRAKIALLKQVTRVPFPPVEFGHSSLPTERTRSQLPRCAPSLCFNLNKVVPVGRQSATVRQWCKRPGNAWRRAGRR